MQNELDLSTLSPEQKANLLKSLLGEGQMVKDILKVGNQTVQKDGVEISFFFGKFVEKVIAFGREQFGPITGDWLSHLGTTEQKQSFVGSWVLTHKATGMRISGKIGNRFDEAGLRRMTLDRSCRDSVLKIQDILDYMQKMFAETFKDSKDMELQVQEQYKVLGQVQLYSNLVDVTSIEGIDRKVERGGRSLPVSERLAMSIAQAKQVKQGQEITDKAKVLPKETLSDEELLGVELE